MNIILLGAIGSGKGTQGTIISKKYHIPSLSTGELLRQSIENNTPDGIEAYKYMSKGMMVPDSIIVSMLENRLKQDDCKNGFLLDGFPRRESQAEALQKITNIDKVLLIDVDRAELINRSLKRRVCPKCKNTYSIDWIIGDKTICPKCNSKLVMREDDNLEQIERRLVTMDPKPMADYYKNKGKLIVINGNVSPEETARQIDSVLAKL